MLRQCTGERQSGMSTGDHATEDANMEGSPDQRISQEQKGKYSRQGKG